MKHKMKHLAGAMKMDGDGLGLCIHRSAAMVLDVPGAELCFGVFAAVRLDERQHFPGASEEAFIHAWVEYGNQVFAPTLIERMGLRPISLTEYYEANGITDVKRLSRAEVLRISGEIGLSAHLRNHTPARASVGKTLMDAAGVAWRDSELGGAVPA